MIPKGASLHSYDHKVVSDLASTPGGGVSMTQQHFTEEVDINTIVRRFGLTGVFPGNVTAGVYGDFTGISDYESAVETIERTRERFMLLPAELREKFSNDPGKLVEFAATNSLEDLEALSAPRPAEPVVDNTTPPPVP